MNKSILSFAAAIVFGSLATPALAGQTCVYLLGEVNGEMVTTAGTLVVVPDSSVEMDPIVVHVDETNQTIIGYEIALPGVDQSYDPEALFVPGVEEEIDAELMTMAEVNLESLTCMEGSRSTPAMPIYIPASELQAPGAFSQIPAIHFNLAGQEFALPGQLLEADGKSIVVPAFTATIPPSYHETPEETISLEFDGDFEMVTHLAPRL